MEPLIPVISEKIAERLASRIVTKLGNNPLQGLMHVDYRHHLVMEAICETLTVQYEQETSN